MTDKRLIDLVLDLADNDQTLSEQAKMLVLAALDGEESLRSELEAEHEATTTPSAPPLDEVPEPVCAYLSSIEVAGFRGIGTKAKLPLHPGPGLIVVAGRNGSGKSSFAEALELALTGDSYRWRRKDARWSSDWHNIHQPTPCEVRIDLAVDNVGTTTVGLDWADGAALDDRATWTQRDGKRREQGLANLGWSAAIVELYRPILSYEELSGLLQAGPSQLHDALTRILGLEQIIDADTRLTNALKRLQEPERQAKELGGQLKDTLAGVEDERAASALAQLTKRKPDIDAVTRLATGTGDQPSGALGQLRVLAHIDIPCQETIDRTVTALRQAIRAVADHGDYSVGLAERRTELLKQAMALHSQHGDMVCPVCGQGALDAGWHDRVASELDRDNAELAKLRASRAELARVRDAARALVSQVPALAVPMGFDLATLPRAEAARQRWLQIPESDAALTEHLAQGYPALAEAVAELRAEAAVMLAEREDRWAPIAGQLSTWVHLRKEAQAQADTMRSLKDAARWVKANAAELRNQQLEPFVAHSRGIWAMLRQESNVDLGKITLEGQGTRRHVELRAEVDGQPAGALSVMSQGELHALALALFLPRATAPSSPFRFVVLDDPIQAMDPAKVDGFVQVLADIAKDRQVVVFSHDDRLADVVRMMAVPGARILEVTRGTGSAVQTRSCLDPARRYVSDAIALTKDPEIPPEVLVKVLPGLCRMAVEAAARDVFYARRFAAGASREATEASWHRTERVSLRVALALHDDARKDISPWREHKTWRRHVLKICGRGAHDGLKTDPCGAVDDLRKTVDDLVEGRS